MQVKGMVKESSEDGQKNEDDRKALRDHAHTQHEQQISIQKYICCVQSKDSVIFKGGLKKY